MVVFYTLEFVVDDVYGVRVPTVKGKGRVSGGNQRYTILFI